MGTDLVQYLFFLKSWIIVEEQVVQTDDLHQPMLILMKRPVKACFS